MCHNSVIGLVSEVDRCHTECGVPPGGGSLRWAKGGELRG